MTTNAIDPVKVLAGVPLAADIHTEAEEDRVFCEQAFSPVLAGSVLTLSRVLSFAPAWGWYCLSPPVRAKTYVPR